MADKIRPRELILGMLVFVGIVMSMALFSQSMFLEYDVDTPNRTFDVFNKTGDLQQLSSDLKERTETRVTGIEPLDNFIVGTFNALELTFSVPDIMATLINEAGEALKISGLIMIIISAAISLVVAFAIIEGVTRGGVF